MAIYTTERARACLLVDWASLVFSVRRTYASSKAGVGVVSDNCVVIRTLKRSLALVPQAPDTNVSIDTLLFGGFTDSSGVDTPELKELEAALVQSRWTGMLSRKCHLRQISPVTTLHPGEVREKIRGLYRGDERVANPNLTFGRAGKCECSWSKLTQGWILQHSIQDPVCPECATQNREVPVAITTTQQKLVDVLLASYALDVARRYAMTDDEGPGQVWICSTDSDVVPVLATIRRWGLRTVWIQPMRNRSHGYRRFLERFGIEIYEMLELLEGDSLGDN